MTMQFPPPYTAPEKVDAALRERGFALLAPDDLCTAWGVSRAQTQTRWQPEWAELPPDAHLRDGGRYRRRRHGCFIVEGAQCQPVPHRAHWQPVDYNALHGGFERWFEPLLPGLTTHADWPALLRALARHADALRGAQPWFVEAHQFRIDTREGIGRPTPEGAHRDGVDLVAVMLLARVGVKGGETRVFDAAGPQGLRFTLTDPFSCLLLDDERVIHETTPIQNLQRVEGGAGGEGSEGGWRDTLVVTYRRGGFQSA